MYVKAYIRIAHRNIRSCSGVLPELVYNGILNLIGHESGVSELLRIDYRIDRKGLSFFYNPAPVYFFHLIIYVICRTCLEVAYGFKNPYGSVQLEIRTVHHFLVARKRNHAASCLDIVGSHLYQFFCKNRLKSHKCLGYEFKFVHICFLCYIQSFLIVRDVSPCISHSCGYTSCPCVLAILVLGFMSSVTHSLAPTTQPSPIVTRPRIVALA